MDNPNSNFKSISEIQNPNLKLEKEKIDFKEMMI
jgi:hypothetical protein